MTLLTHVKTPSTLRHLRRRDGVAGGGVDFRIADVGERVPAASRAMARFFPGPVSLVEPATGPEDHDLAARHRYAIESSAGSEMVRKAITRIDGYLSYCCGVRPFSLDERCLLRCAAIASPGSFSLSDGTALRQGDAVIDLHLWNEHIPPVPKRGPDLAWARLVAQWMKLSLVLLAEAVASDPEFRDVKAVRAKTNFVGWGGHSESMSRLIGRFGFEDVDEGSSSVPVRVHDALENILIGALTWTHNPEALRRDKLIRQRRPVWMSAATLVDRHRGD